MRASNAYMPTFPSTPTFSSTYGRAALLAALISCGCGADATRRPPRTARSATGDPNRQAEVQRQAVNCGRQVKIVLASEIARPRAEVLTEALQLAAVLRRLDRMQGHTPPPTAVKRCHAETAGLVRELATRWHREAGKTMRQITFTRTRMLYEAYLATFPAARDRRRISFYLGEVLFKLQRWPEAAAAYNSVVRLDPAGKLKLTREAAYAAVITLKNAAEQADKGTRGQVRSTSSRRPRPIPPLLREFLAAAERYLRLVPTAPERVALLYHRARIYYEYNHHQQAVKFLSQLVDRHPGHELTVYAANLLLDSLNQQQRYDTLAHWVDRMLAEPKLAQGELATTLHQLKLNVGRKQAEQQRRDGKYKACGERYLKLVARYPKNSRRAELLHNAAICFDLAKLHDRAIATRKNLITSTPKAALVPRALLQVADTYATQKKGALAAHFLEWYAQRFPAEREAPDALKRAFALRMAGGEHDKARADALLFSRNYARRRRFARDAARLELALGAIFEHKGDHAGAARHYANVVRRWKRAAGGVALLAMVKRAEAQWASACPVKGVRGICAAPRTRTALTQGCQRPVSPALRLRRRTAAAGRAQAALTRALAEIKRAGPSQDDPELRAAAAGAAFLAAEPTFEAFLALGPPRLPVTAGAVSMTPRAQRALRTYLAAKKQRLTEARAAYQRVIDAATPPLPNPAAAALARTAQLSLSFADQLLAIPLPRVVAPAALKGSARTDYLKTWRETYCDALDNQVTPLHAAARTTLQRCTALAAKHKLNGRWARLCQQLTAALP